MLEAQRESLTDIDDKAMRTVRTTVLLLGIFVSAIEIGELTVTAWLAYLGGIMLVVSLLLGLATYDESDPYLGPSSGYVRQLLDDDFEDNTWNEDLITTFAYWIEENGQTVRRNSRLLRWTQISLFLDILIVVPGIVFWWVWRKQIYMTEIRSENPAEKGQRSHKGSAFLSRLFGWRDSSIEEYEEAVGKK